MIPRWPQDDLKITPTWPWDDTKMIPRLKTPGCASHRCTPRTGAAASSWARSRRICTPRCLVKPSWPCRSKLQLEDLTPLQYLHDFVQQTVNWTVEGFAVHIDSMIFSIWAKKHLGCSVNTPTSTGMESTLKLMSHVHWRREKSLYRTHSLS